MREPGKLAALLAQFPPSFKSSPASREYLGQLLRLFADYPMAVELRHSSWSDAFGETLQLLNGFDAAWVQIDEPKFRFSIRQNSLPNVTGFYYMRLHGRNAAQWWRHDKSEDRYNYLYSADELREFSDTAGAAKALVKKAYLYTNNHFSAKSVVNAVMLKAQLGEPIEGEYPPELVERYPEIRDLVNSRLPTPDSQVAIARRLAELELEVGIYFTVTRRMMSLTASFRATSIPEVTWPKTVKSRSSFGCAANVMYIWLSPRRGSPGCAAATAPMTCFRFTSATPMLRPLPPEPQRSRFVMSRVCGSPNCTTNPGTTRCTRSPL